MQLNSYLDAGPEALIGAVRELTGEPVDHYVEVDFRSFTKVVDALGGVRMFVPSPMRDRYSGLDLRSRRLHDVRRLHRARRGVAAVTPSASRAAAGSTRVRMPTWTGSSGSRRCSERSRRRPARGSAPTSAKASDVLDAVVPSLKVDDRMTRDTIRSFVGHLVRPEELTAATVPTELVPDAPGRLRLVPRPAGSDFFRWAAPPPSASAPIEPAPAAGDTC